MMSQHTEQNQWKDLKTFRNVSISTGFASLKKTVNSHLELFVGQEEILIQNG